MRNLGSTQGIEPQHRYDVLAVVNQHRVWLIPAARLDGRDTVTLKPGDPNCPFTHNRRR